MKRTLLTVTVLVALIPFAPSPASAAQLVIISSGNSGGTHRVNGQCAAVIGLSTSLNEFQYVVQGEMSSRATDSHTVATATGVTCWIRDAGSHAQYGNQVSLSLPGPHAEIVGKINHIPRSAANLELCSRGNGLFLDNHTAAFTVCTS